MLMYLVGLAVTIFLSFLTEKNKTKKLGKILAIIWLIALAIIAGMRSIDVGYDAQKYVATTEYRLRNSESFSAYMNVSTTEPGFSILSYMLYSISPDIHFLLFGYSFLTTLFVLVFAFREKNSMSIAKIFILYYLTLYLYSFNIVRQTIPISMMLVAISLLKSKKIWPTIILTIVAATFHDSFFMAIPIFFIFYIFGKTSKRVSRGTHIFIICAILTVICLFYAEIAHLFFNAGIISQRYYSYITASDNADSNIINIGLSGFWLALSFILYKFVQSETTIKKNLFPIITSLAIALIINIASCHVHPLYRIGQYYYYAGIFYLFPSLKNYLGKIDKKNRHIIHIIIYAFLVFCFCWITIIGNTYHIYPYR